MQVEIFAPQGGWQRMVDAALWSEEAGFDSLGVPEIAHDPFIPLALSARATQRIGLRSAIAVAFARSPMVLANLAWDLHQESGGRFVLGLGTQVQAHVERRFASPWVKPRTQLAEYVRSIRAIHRAWEKREKLRFKGQHYSFSLMTPEFAPEPTGRAPVPIYTAAVRPAMIELAGEVADGVRLHGFMTRKYQTDVALPAIERGLAARGRARSNFEVCGGGFVATGPDTDTVARLREAIRYRVAFYASTTSYWPVLEAHGLKDLGQKLRQMTLSGQWTAMAQEISDEVLDLFCVSATWRDLAPVLERRFGGLTDSIELAFPGAAPAAAARELVQDVHRVASPCSRVVTSWDEVPAGEPDPARNAALPHLSA